MRALARRRLIAKPLGSEVNATSKRRRKGKALRDRALAGRSIATRTMTIHGRRRPVVVSLGKPEPDAESNHGDWRCPVRISGVGPQRLRFGRGIDAFQSLITALAVIRHTLEPHRAELSWAGGELDLAFPRLVPGGFPGQFAQRIEKFIARELAALLRSLKRKAEGRAAQPATAAARGRVRS